MPTHAMRCPSAARPWRPVPWDRTLHTAGGSCTHSTASCGTRAVRARPLPPRPLACARTRRRYALCTPSCRAPATLPCSPAPSRLLAVNQSIMAAIVALANLEVLAFTAPVAVKSLSSVQMFSE
eukprot:5515797-Prymnesium_polylepis.1